MNTIKSVMQDSAKAAKKKKQASPSPAPKKARPQKNSPIVSRELEIYSVAATLYGEAGGLEKKGIIRVAETIRNRHTYYSKNKAKGVEKITYRDILCAPNQYLAFNVYKNKSLKDFQKYENDLSDREKKNWDICKEIAQQVVDNKLKSNLARGALGFNQASVAANQKNFNTTNVFKDDARYVNDPKKSSSHVFFGDFYLSPLKTPKGKLLAKGGNPKDDNPRYLAQKRTNGGRT